MDHSRGEERGGALGVARAKNYGHTTTLHTHTINTNIQGLEYMYIMCIIQIRFYSTRLFSSHVWENCRLCLRNLLLIILVTRSKFLVTSCKLGKDLVLERNYSPSYV